jgi:hypothetical protein
LQYLQGLYLKAAALAARSSLQEGLQEKKLGLAGQDQREPTRKQGITTNASIATTSGKKNRRENQDDTRLFPVTKRTVEEGSRYHLEHRTKSHV